MPSMLSNYYFAWQQLGRLRPYRVSAFATWQFLLKVAAKRLDDDQACEFQLDGLRFRVRPRDWYGLQEVLLADEYGPLRAALSDDHNVHHIVDLGANVGLFSLQCLRDWPACQLYAVEAAPDTYELLHQNLMGNPQLAKRTHHLAICDHNGEVAFDARPLSTGRRLANGQTDTVRVPASTLAGYLALLETKTIDLLKMDIEGAEEAALCTQPECLANVRHLIVELHPDSCDAARVGAVLRERYGYIYAATGRASGKPLLLATDMAMDLPAFDLARLSGARTA